MKKLLYFLLFITLSAGCSSSSSDGIGPSDKVCGQYNGKTLYTGPKGGCYYINSNNNKEYVDRSNCKC